MSKIGTKLHYRKFGSNTTYDINLYNSINDVGSLYITLRVSSQLVYAQVGCPCSDDSTPLLIRQSNGSLLAVKSKVGDSAMLATGTIVNPGNVIPASSSAGGYYQGSGQNVPITWTTTPAWYVVPDSNIQCQYTVTINPSLTLGDTDHYRLLFVNSDNPQSLGYGGTGGTSAGTISSSQRKFTVTLGVGPYYFQVAAEDVSNNVLYSSATYGPVYSNWTTKAANGFSYHVNKADSLGNNPVRVYDGTGTANIAAGTAYTTYGADASDNSSTVVPVRRYFSVGTTYTNPWPGDSGVKWSTLSCADTCACNCNYCTCNCNYCGCNCNYCTCNCDYSPCSCSSGN